MWQFDFNVLVINELNFLSLVVLTQWLGVLTYSTGLRLSECIVAKPVCSRAKVTMRAYRKSYEKSIGAKMYDLDLCFKRSYQGLVNHCVIFDVEYLGNR